MEDEAAMSDCSTRAFGIPERSDVKEYDQFDAMRGRVVMKPPCRDVPIVMGRYETGADGELMRREADYFEFDGDRYERVEKRPYQEKDLDWMGA